MNYLQSINQVKVFANYYHRQMNLLRSSHQLQHSLPTSTQSLSGRHGGRRRSHYDIYLNERARESTNVMKSSKLISGIAYL